MQSNNNVSQRNSNAAGSNGNNINSTVATLEALFKSLQDLGNAIYSAKDKLSTRDNVPGKVIDRLVSYEQILNQQRQLAIDLCNHIQHGNSDEISRHVNLINNLSKMIRDDAREVLATVTTSSNKNEGILEKAENLIIC